MDASDATLADVRAEVDAIDDALLALIARRLAVADRVRAIKPHDVSPVRGRREADVLARVAAGPVPARLAERVWRALIGAMLAREGVAGIVAETDALAAAADARFGGQLNVRVGDARAAAADPLWLGAVAHDGGLPGGGLPGGVGALVAIAGAEGTVGWIVGRVAA